MSCNYYPWNTVQWKSVIAWVKNNSKTRVCALCIHLYHCCIQEWFTTILLRTQGLQDAIDQLRETQRSFRRLLELSHTLAYHLFHVAEVSQYARCKLTNSISSHALFVISPPNHIYFIFPSFLSQTQRQLQSVFAHLAEMEPSLHSEHTANAEAQKVWWSYQRWDWEDLFA